MTSWLDTQYNKIMNDTDYNWCFAWSPVEPDDLSGTNRQGLARDTKWNSGDVLTISFLDGDDSLRKKVKEYANEWTGKNGANLTLAFRKDTIDTMIRISFQFSGSWSVIGRGCLKTIGSSRPTMNLQLKPDSSEDIIRRSVLHEFGHALGLIHEHQIPGHGIQWNQQRVVSDLSGPPYLWSRKDIDINVLSPASPLTTNYSAFDPESIMLYPIPAEWTIDNFSVGWNSTLSENDLEFIHRQYP